MGNDDSLTALAAEGESVVLVAADPARTVAQATWAPDGRLAVWTEVDSTAGRATIAMGDADDQRRIDGGTVPFFYAWNPGGDHVAYLGNAPDGSGVAMGLVDVAAGTARLVDSGAPYYLDWAPDGSRLAVHTDNTDVALIDLEGRRDPLPVEPGLFQAPEYLSDGRILIATAGDERGVAVVGADGAVRTVGPADGVTFFSSSAAEDLVAYTDNSNNEVLGSLQVVGIDGSGHQTVTEGPVVAFEWSPTGARLLFLTLDRAARALVPRIWETGRLTEFEAVIPTAQTIAQYLPFWDQYSRVLNLWAADAGSFVLAVDRQGSGEIVLFDVESGQSRRLAAGRFASFAEGSGNQG
jgi:dipeptidyl aminopeptidase/acylaminoacyl peptidase